MRATLSFSQQREINTLLNNWAATPPAVGHPCPVCRRVFVQTTTLGEPCLPCQEEADREEYYASLKAEREAEEADRELGWGRPGHPAWENGDRDDDGPEDYAMGGYE